MSLTETLKPYVPMGGADEQVSGRCELLSGTTEFSVIAGKLDGLDKNCKYSDCFATLDEAIEALDKVSSYPWAHIQYKGRVLDLFWKGYDPF